MKIFEMEMENALKGIYAEVKHTNKILETSQEKFAEQRNSMKKKPTHTLIDYEQRKYEVMKDVFTNTIVRMVVKTDEVADTFIERALIFSEKAADKFIERLKAGGERR